MLAMNCMKVNVRQTTASGLSSSRGFTLLELLTVIAILGIIMAIAIPAYSSIYGATSLKATSWEIVNMIKEAKHLAAFDNKYYAVTLDPKKGTITLTAGRGDDGKWNTQDDEVIRSFNLNNKAGGIKLGYGSIGPIPDHAETKDGISFQVNNSIVCNPDMTGNAGTVYISSSSGSVMAVSVNSKDVSCSIWRGDGGKWVKM